MINPHEKPDTACWPIKGACGIIDRLQNAP